MEKQFPFLHLENLEAVEASIAEVEAETREMSAAQSKPKIITTIEESRRNKIDIWKGNDDIIKGLKFCATMQLRTPLRVLMRHGEIHTGPNTEPPKIAMEMREGIWGMETKSWEEVACGPDSTPEDIEVFRRMDTALADSRTVASDAGPVLVKDYLPFLIAIRKIIELDEPIEDRIDKLRKMPIATGWKVFVDRYGPNYRNENKGMEWVIEYFFPRFIKSIPTLSAGMVDELCKLGLDTPNRIAAAFDETLLSIKGIGKAKLGAIRAYCDGITDNRDARRKENVTR